MESIAQAFFAIYNKPNIKKLGETFRSWNFPEGGKAAAIKKVGTAGKEFHNVQ